MAFKGQPPLSTTILGCLASSNANFNRWEDEVDQQAAVCGYFGAASQPDLAGYGDWTEQRDRAPRHIMWTPRFIQGYSDTATAQASLRSIAEGLVDWYICQQGAAYRAAIAAGQSVYLRPFHEINGSWGSVGYAHQPSDGSDQPRARNRGPSSDWGLYFRQAWRRLVAIYAGGTQEEINARITAWGAGTANFSQGTQPRTNVAFLWNPNRNPNPDVAWNQPEHYWPGDTLADARFVDGVACDAYSLWAWSGVISAARGPDWLYRTFCAAGPQLPFYWTELGTRGTDDPAWHRSLFAWIRERPLVAGVFYFQQSAQDGNSLIETCPQVRDVWRDELTDPRFVKDPATIAGWNAWARAGAIDGGGSAGDDDPPPPDPISVIPRYGHLGAGELSSTIGLDWKYAQLVEVDPATEVGTVVADLAGAAAGPQDVRAIVAADAADAEHSPLTILAVSAPVTVAQNAARARRTFTFAAPFAPGADLVWVALVGSTPGAGALYFYDETPGAWCVYGRTAGMFSAAAPGGVFGAVSGRLERRMVLALVAASGQDLTGAALASSTASADLNVGAVPATRVAHVPRFVSQLVPVSEYRDVTDGALIVWDSATQTFRHGGDS